MCVTPIAPILANIYHPAPGVKRNKAKPVQATSACERGQAQLIPNFDTRWGR